MQTKAHTTHGLTVATTATRSQNASTRRGILIASLIAMGITPPAEIGNAALVVCHNAARRLERHENPYVRRGVFGRSLCIEGIGIFRIMGLDEQKRFREAAELEQIAIELRAIEAKPEPAGVVENPVEDTPALSMERMRRHLADIESLAMPK